MVEQTNTESTSEKDLEEKQNSSKQNTGDGADDKGNPEPGQDGDESKKGDEGSKPKDDGKPESKKESEPDKTTERVVPDEYNLKLPKRSSLDESAIKSVAEFAKANKLTETEAQAILERESALEAARVESQEKQLKEAQGRWLDELKSDKELGGEKFKEVSEVALRAIEKLGSDELRDELDRTGLGNHPELVRFAYRAGKLLQDDKVILGRSNPEKRKPTASVLYGDKK